MESGPLSWRSPARERGCRRGRTVWVKVGGGRCVARDRISVRVAFHRRPPQPRSVNGCASPPLTGRRYGLQHVAESGLLRRQLPWGCRGARGRALFTVCRFVLNYFNMDTWISVKTCAELARFQARWIALARSMAEDVNSPRAGRARRIMQFLIMRISVIQGLCGERSEHAGEHVHALRCLVAT